MQITTTLRHCDLDPEVRLFAENRLGRLRRYAGDILEAHLIVTAEKYRHTAEITLRLRHHELVGREHSTDPRMAIDRAADALEEQLRRLKGRRVDRKREARATARVVNGRPVGAAEAPGEDALESED
jgi:putative sigma-54 modulation protein